MEITFTGGEADNHIIEVFSGSESLAGIARAAVLVAHYASTGEFRFRAPYSNVLEFYISAPNEGSLEFPLKALAKIKSAAAANKKKLAIALLGLVIARATGQVSSADISLDGLNIGVGDVDALAEAATPGLMRAHYWIANPHQKISLVKDDGSSVSLSSSTKRYMETEEIGPSATIDVSVAALNANSKIGRVYFNDLGRTIPFKVAKEAKGRTVANLSRYLTQYIRKTGAVVNITYQPVYYPDKRLKRIIIFDCFAVDGEA